MSGTSDDLGTQSGVTLPNRRRFLAGGMGLAALSEAMGRTHPRRDENRALGG
jgi:hypothetical protein